RLTSRRRLQTDPAELAAGLRYTARQRSSRWRPSVSAASATTPGLLHKPGGTARRRGRRLPGTLRPTGRRQRGPPPRCCPDARPLAPQRPEPLLRPSAPPVRLGAAGLGRVVPATAVRHQASSAWAYGSVLAQAIAVLHHRLQLLPVGVGSGACRAPGHLH